MTDLKSVAKFSVAGSGSILCECYKRLCCFHHCLIGGQKCLWENILLCAVKVKEGYRKPKLTQMKAQIIFFIVLSELPIPKSILENQRHEDEAKPPTCADFFTCVASYSSEINDWVKSLPFWKWMNARKALDLSWKNTGRKKHSNYSPIRITAKDLENNSGG